MAKRGKTGKPTAMELDDNEDERTSIAPGSDQSLEGFVQELFGSTTYTHEKGKLPPIEWLQSKFQTKSAIIRFLFEEGHEPKVIAKTYGFKYQHVRNVLTNELKRGPNEPFRLDDHYNIKLSAPNYAPKLQPRSKEPLTAKEDVARGIARLGPLSDAINPREPIAPVYEPSEDGPEPREYEAGWEEEDSDDDSE